MLDGGLISIIVPVYNIRDYVEKCVSSIIQQTYHNLEIILVDDGSTDGSGKICDQYIQKDARIRVYHKKNGGLSDARNYGLDRMTGAYVAFVDGDDWVHPQMYEILLSVMQKEQADLVSCEFEREDPSFAENLIIMEDIKYNVFSREQVIANLGISKIVAWNKLYRAKIFDNIRYPYGKLHEDEYVIHEIIWRCKKIVSVDKAMYFYMVRDNSIVAKLTPKRIEDALTGLEERIRFIAEHCTEEGLESAIKGYCDYAIATYYSITDDKDGIDNIWKERLWKAESAVVRKYGRSHLPVQYKEFAKSPRKYERWKRIMKRKEHRIQVLSDVKHRALLTWRMLYDKMNKKN